MLKSQFGVPQKIGLIPAIHHFPRIGHFRRKDGFLVQKCLPVLAAFVAKMDSWLESAAPLRVSAGTGVRFSPVCRSKRVGMTTNHKGMTQAVIAKNEPRTHWFAANLSRWVFVRGPRRAQIFQTCLAELYKLEKIGIEPGELTQAVLRGLGPKRPYRARSWTGR